MNDEQRALLLERCSRFPPPPGLKLSYGTAGFRADASILQSTLFRIGILAALRSLMTKSVIGLMITASHNKESDNGVKIADPNGGMLTQVWEPFADALVNAHDNEHIVQLIIEFAKNESISFGGAQSPKILLGRDTRPSGEFLLEAAKQGVGSIVGTIAFDMGVVTTPQLHWMVRARNKGINASEIDYFKQLVSSFRCLIDLIPKKRDTKQMEDKLVVDGANGVGGEKLEVLKSMLNDLDIEIRNSGKGGGLLNEGVGADFVQKEKALPRGFGASDVGKRCASLDGDADRLVYFSVPSNISEKVDLVDGDKILSLLSLFVKEQLDILNNGDEKNHYKAQLGVVQTAYANGAATDYLKSLGLEVSFTRTGVKFLHEKAAEHDIGIYFEANGHGTIVFSEPFLCWLDSKNKDLLSSAKGSEQQKAARRLLAVSQLINQAVGDALSGLLLVEAVLQQMGWTIHDWNKLYQDLPSKQLKVKVVDRNAVVTTAAETSVVEPPGIQKAINLEIEKYRRGRCFIRPSGTEDVVRVYAEASSQEDADSLAMAVAQIVEDFLGFASSH